MLHVGRLAYISADADSRAAIFSNRRNGLFALYEIDICNHHARACRAKATAVARPMPAAPPVTTITFPAMGADMSKPPFDGGQGKSVRLKVELCSRSPSLVLYLIRRVIWE